MKKFLSVLSLLSVLSAFAADSAGSGVLAIELDGIVATHPGVQVGHFTGINLSSMSFWDRAKALKLLAQVPALTRDFRTIEGSTHGIGNVFYGLADRIRTEYGVNLTDEVAQQLVDCFTHPAMDVAALAAIRKIKESGEYKVMGATHMDAKHFDCWKEKAEMGEDGDQFDAYVTTRFAQYDSTGGALFTDRGNSVYMVNDEAAVEPKKEVSDTAQKTDAYFDVVAEVGRVIQPSTSQFAYVGSSQNV